MPFFFVGVSLLLLSLIGRSHTNLGLPCAFFFKLLEWKCRYGTRYLHQEVLFGHITSLSVGGPHRTYVGTRANILSCVGDFRSMVSPSKGLLWRLNLTQSKTKSKFSSLVGLGCPIHLVEAKLHNARAGTRLRAKVWKRHSKLHQITRIHECDDWECKRKVRIECGSDSHLEGLFDQGWKSISVFIVKN